MTMTTSRRFDLWLRTIQSLRDSVSMDCVTKCVIIDDGSDKDDRTKMLALFPSYFPAIPVSIVVNDVVGPYRHQHSLELWRALIWNEDYVFHVEDDWLFDDTFIGALDWAKILLSQHDWIGQVAFPKRKRTFPLGACPFWVMTEDNSPDFAPSRFTLQPSVIRVESIRKTGGFRQEDFEVEYGRRWAGRGYVPVYHPTGICTHMDGESAYTINQSRR